MQKDHQEPDRVLRFNTLTDLVDRILGRRFDDQRVVSRRAVFWQVRDGVYVVAHEEDPPCEGLLVCTAGRDVHAAVVRDEASREAALTLVRGFYGRHRATLGA